MEGLDDAVERRLVPVHKALHILEDECLGKQAAYDFDDMEAQETSRCMMEAMQ